MTLDEAQKVAGVCGNADGGCSSCVNELAKLLNATFPQFEWTATDDYVSIFDWEQETRRDYCEAPTECDLWCGGKRMTVKERET